jgi:protein-S-isoprenylcysteine O-methyltransferase Ste14
MTVRAVVLRKRSVQNWIFLVPLLVLIAVRLTTATPAAGLGRPSHSLLQHPLAIALLTAAGLLMIGVGLVLRVLARGWKAENSRGRLVTSGLYAYIRHPLYAASFLIGLGLCLILGDMVVLAVYVPLFVGVHTLVIHGEERWMARHWGEEYRRYAARVPRFLPRPRRRKRAEQVRPRHLIRAIGKEADAICAWLCLAFLLLGWKSLAGGPQPIAVVPLSLAAACLILWPSLKRAAKR